MHVKIHAGIVSGIITFLCTAIAGAADRIEQNLPPEISHIPTAIGFRGQPIPIYANVKDKTGKLKSVSLFYTLSQQKAPLEVRMKKVKGSRYSGLIPANFFNESTKIWYYIEARDSFDDKGETTWMPVVIKDPDAERVQEATEAAVEPVEKAAAGTSGSAGSTAQPIPAGAVTSAEASSGGIPTGVWIGAGVLAAGGGIAIAAGSGGGSDDDGGGGGFDPANTVSVSANQSASGGFSSGAQDTAIDGSGAVAGKTVTGVRVTLNYEAFDIPDRFQIIYQGNVIGDTGEVSGNNTIQEIAGGSSPQVIIRVLTPSGGTSWEWNATVEFSAK